MFIDVSDLIERMVSDVLLKSLLKFALRSVCTHVMPNMR